MRTDGHEANSRFSQFRERAYKTLILAHKIKTIYKIFNEVRIPVGGDSLISTHVRTGFGTHSASTVIGTSVGTHPASTVMGTSFGTHPASTVIGTGFGTHPASTVMGTSFGTHPASTVMGIVVLSLRKSGHSVIFATHLNQEPRLGLTGAVPPDLFCAFMISTEKRYRFVSRIFSHLLRVTKVNFLGELWTIVSAFCTCKENIVPSRQQRVGQNSERWRLWTTPPSPFDA
jgi:hypothetical protein